MTRSHISGAIQMGKLRWQRQEAAPGAGQVFEPAVHYAHERNGVFEYSGHYIVQIARFA